MRITDLQPFPLSIPFRPMSPPSPWAEGARKQIMIKVLTDEGLVGCGVWHLLVRGAGMAT
jgi:L-alanine-DL-glutamate epimerase-like enolase superfamily enzyme